MGAEEGLIDADLIPSCEEFHGRFVDKASDICPGEWNATNAVGEDHWCGSGQVSPVRNIVTRPNRAIPL
jgi:hypothetical protein